MSMIEYARVLKECFWDSNIDKNELIDIIESGNERELKKLFFKIIYNSQDKLLDLQIFSKDQIRDFLSDFKITYNKKYIHKHIQIIKSLLLDEDVKIKELEWKKL